MAEEPDNFANNDESQYELENEMDSGEQHNTKEEIEQSKTTETNVEEESPEDVDNRSVFVGNVDYSATPDEVQEHFKESGTINRVTILYDKFSGNPKGFAYVEFQDKDSVQQAILLNDSVFKGRKIKVTPKRTNVPNMSRGRKIRRRIPYYGARGRWMYVRAPRRFPKFRHF